MNTIAIVVLAAGASSRMQGRDKLMEKVDSIPLLRRQVKRALGTGCQVFVTVPPPPHARHSAIEGLGCTAVAVADANEGMNASLRAGVRAVPDSAEAVMVVLADMPDITTADLNSVLQAIDLESGNLIWRATTAAGLAGHPIVFHKGLLPDLIALNGDSGGKAVVQNYRTKTVAIALPADHARTDLDTPEAWDVWRAGNGPI